MFITNVNFNKAEFLQSVYEGTALEAFKLDDVRLWLPNARVPAYHFIIRGHTNQVIQITLETFKEQKSLPEHIRILITKIPIMILSQDIYRKHAVAMYIREHYQDLIEQMREEYIAKEGGIYVQEQI